MESTVLKLLPMQEHKNDTSNSSDLLLSNVFSDKTGTYLNGINLFLACFNYIPNLIEEEEIDCRKANKWFSETYHSAIKEFYYDKIYLRESKKAEYDDLFYFIYDDLIVNFDTNMSKVRFLFKKTDIDKVELVINQIRKVKKRKARVKPRISLLINTNHGIDTKDLIVTKPKLKIEDNYNDDFLEIHHTILKRLQKKNDKGLVLLHGLPGTGKTSYIRYLINSVRKKVIFLPPIMAGAITSPDLISILIDNPNCVLVIEDAENIVVDREKDGHSPVAAILNISDGLLSDCLNIQVICSFNTDISKIDSALMRKGRLIAKYEFRELEVEKVQVLSEKLGYRNEINSPMTLTAIYNQGENCFVENRKRNLIGFNLQNYK